MFYIIKYKMKKVLFGIFPILLLFSNGTLAQENTHIEYDNINGNITVYSENFEYWITIQDKNVWAENVWDFWLYFQRWNNYGNTWESETTTGLLEYNSSYDNNWYNWEIKSYIKVGENAQLDIWTGWNHYDNLRGWGKDKNNAENIVKWYDTINHKVINAEWRRWPCESWYHVPSAWEWHELMILYFKSIWAYSELLTQNDPIFSRAKRYQNWEYWQNFAADMRLPYAWVRTNWSGYDNNIHWYYRSSSPWGNYETQARRLRIQNTWKIDPSSWRWRAHGQSIRCFKNQYIPKTYDITFKDKNTNETINVVNIEVWWTITEEMLPTAPIWHRYEYYDTDNNEITDTIQTITINNDTTIYVKKIINNYTITFNTDGWSEIQPITQEYWTTITPPTPPTKQGYLFKWWSPSLPLTMPAENITIKALWLQENSWASWWWGKVNNNAKENENNKEENIQNNTEEENNNTDTTKQEDDNKFSQEFIQAYNFAFENWITTVSPINKANLEWKLTRIAMAKMLSQYAINVLWMEPDTNRNNKFNDVTDDLDARYNNGVTLAYQLWIMWINMPKNNFRPDDEVTRAEFWTALSRLLFKTEDWKDYYYTTHLNKLMETGIITNNDPKLKELRWYVMIMLMRSKN